MTLDEIQREVGQWHRNMLPDATASEIVLKTCAQVGELADAQQQMNLNEIPGRAREWMVYAAKRSDAIGNIVICLAALCDRAGISLEQVVEQTWDDVSQRSMERVRNGS